MFSCPKMHLCISYCQEEETPQVKLNDMTRELSLKIFCIAFMQYQLLRNARVQHEVKWVRGLSSVGVSKLFDNLDLNSSICKPVPARRAASWTVPITTHN